VEEIMKFYRHKTYKDYKKAQIKANKEKLGKVSVKPKTIVKISNYIKRNIPDVKFGICHGVRNGYEVKKFREILKVKVIGTDISPTVKKFPHCIEHDFHTVRREWIHSVDFIYSNALDHSYAPEYCLDQWMRCLSPKGRCFIEWGQWHNVLSDKYGEYPDCYAATLEEYRNMISKKYLIVDELRQNFGKTRRGNDDIRTILVIGGI
jgi:hypothetical protein